jgi:ribosomal protein S18 acetylase RimI-like enzyme
MIEVKQLVSGEWELMKAIRLRSLGDAPDAFGSDYAREAAFTEQDWRRRFTTSAAFVAMDGEAAVGIVGGMPHDDGRKLVAMWVAPKARGKRVAGLLIDAVVADAAQRGFSAVCLDVFKANSSALRAYERYGFGAVRDVSPDKIEMSCSVAK